MLTICAKVDSALVHQLNKDVFIENGIELLNFGDTVKDYDVQLIDVRQKGFKGGRNENSPFDIGIIYKGILVGQYKTLKRALSKVSKLNN